MKAHIVGGGFGGLAAAALLIRNADVPGADITIYEADDAGRETDWGDPVTDAEYLAEPRQHAR
jgi:oleate hydratase